MAVSTPLHWIDLTPAQRQQVLDLGGRLAERPEDFGYILVDGDVTGIRWGWQPENTEEDENPGPDAQQEDPNLYLTRAEMPWYQSNDLDQELADAQLHWQQGVLSWEDYGPDGEPDEAFESPEDAREYYKDARKHTYGQGEG